MIMSDRNKVKTVTRIKSDQTCENKRQALSQIKRIDWKSLEFRTPNQKTFYNIISRNDVTFSVGPAGCGKTFLATHYALKNLAKGKYDKMVITKPLVEVDGEKMGYLPGDIDEKTMPYMMSLYYNMEQIIGKQRLDVLRDAGVIKVIPLAYMRGLTLTNTCVILDEAQNTLPIQIKTFLTRIGQGSKFIVNGDLLQTDIHHENGLEDSIKRLVGVRGLGMSKFTTEDIVRHPIVADVLSRYAPDWKVSHDSAEATMSNYIENGQAFASKVRDKINKYYN